MKYNILFVDDENQILEGIQDSLRKHRRQWNMSFVVGGEAAIAELRINNYDVIVCDMRMPSVTGTDVLKFAKQHHPATIRIMLSGFSDLESTVDISSVAHRYLSKPCDFEELETTIRGSLQLSEKINNDAIKAIAGSVDLLPMSNSAHQKLMDFIRSEDTHIADIAQIIESDVALTAKTLHLVNSSFFRRSRIIDSAKDAATFLGTDLIKSIVLANQLFLISDEADSVDKDKIDRLQKQSWLTASIAKYLMSDTKYADTAFTAGLLHGIGTLALCVKRPELLDSTKIVKTSVENNSDADGHEFYDSAMEVQLGAYLLNLWGMPINIVEAIAFYEQPSALNSNIFNVAGAVHIANHLAEVCMTDNYQTHFGDNLDTEYLSALNLEHRLDNWLLSAKLIAADTDSTTTSIHSRNAA